MLLYVSAFRPDQIRLFFLYNYHRESLLQFSKIYNIPSKFKCHKKSTINKPNLRSMRKLSHNRHCRHHISLRIRSNINLSSVHHHCTDILHMQFICQLPRWHILSLIIIIFIGIRTIKKRKIKDKKLEFLP